MKPTVLALVQTGHYLSNPRLAAATADGATRLQSLWQGRGVMTRTWLSSLRSQLLLVFALLGVERVTAQRLAPVPGSLSGNKERRS